MTQHLFSQNTITSKERGQNPSTEVPNTEVPIRGLPKGRANKHSFNQTQTRNTGSIKILKRHGAHTSHRLKTQLNKTLVKTPRDWRHLILDALFSACSPVEAQLNLDDPKFHVNTPPVFDEHMKLTWLISSKSEQYRSLGFIT